MDKNRAIHTSTAIVLLAVAAIAIITLGEMDGKKGGEVLTDAGSQNSTNASLGQAASAALRLEGEAQYRNLTLADVENLKMLAGGNEELLHEIDEMEWMIGHGYAKHAVHSLEKIYYIAKGEEYLCPADAISHVRPFLEAGEIERAEHVTLEGAEQLERWSEKVRSVKLKTPIAYPGLEELISAMNATVMAMQAGDYATAASESGYVEREGYC